MAVILPIPGTLVAKPYNFFKLVSLLISLSSSFSICSISLSSALGDFTPAFDKVCCISEPQSLNSLIGCFKRFCVTHKADRARVNRSLICITTSRGGSQRTALSFFRAGILGNALGIYLIIFTSLNAK